MDNTEVTKRSYDIMSGLICKQDDNIRLATGLEWRKQKYVNPEETDKRKCAGYDRWENRKDKRE